VFKYNIYGKDDNGGRIYLELVWGVKIYCSLAGSWNTWLCCPSIYEAEISLYPIYLSDITMFTLRMNGKNEIIQWWRSSPRSNLTFAIR
jgi:hypothetical protein